MTTRIKKRRVSEFMGAGCVIQGFAVLVLIAGIGFSTQEPISGGITFLLSLILFLAGSAKSRRLVCGECGNPVTKELRMCPVCKASFD